MAAAFLALAMLLLAMTGRASCTWCVCKEMPDSVLQKTLDYACGAGADCAPTHQNGPCFQPNNVRAHCSYAVNSYFQKKGQSQGTCDFSGTATISTSDPSSSGCSFPATSSAAGSGTTSTTPVTPTTGTPTTTTPSNTTPSTSTPTTTTPYTTTPSNGVLGGIGSGVSPTGAGINTDMSYGGVRLHYNGLVSVFTTLLALGLLRLWG